MERYRRAAFYHRTEQAAHAREVCREPRLLTNDQWSELHKELGAVGVDGERKRRGFAVIVGAVGGVVVVRLGCTASGEQGNKGERKEVLLHRIY